jgi:hypothetical protein
MVLEQGGYISLLPLASRDVVFEEDVNLGGGWMSARRVSTSASMNRDQKALTPSVRLWDVEKRPNDAKTGATGVQNFARVEDV